MLKLINITKSFGDNIVLKDLSLEIESDKTTVIIGSSGSGKSTLLRCINMLSEPDAGIFSYKDMTLNFSDKLDRRLEYKFKKLTGMVFQGFNLFPHKTVIENIVLAPITVNSIDKKIAYEEAEILLKQVGLFEKKDQYPHELSGGQQQRIAIARALAMKPDIMLFDEPTSALDPEIELEILKLISKVTKGNFTNIIVTHNMNFAKEISDKVIFLEKGQVLAEGTYEQLNTSDNVRIKQFLNTIG
ncbi:amino acid ABC transporter ATP-binding protein [Tissierella creatinophila]|uniref:Arginine transport ATP-binding protein ArtM n=1 Tax=Tissierella creatinophila DSM 6911 TaxID=1123403 RepID=A0A1U7M2I6_TISCR|nr:amino acid ABC transporter ATP-binding protein [Tissierella creatinophila]OLS01495.1 arginine transport ATP-binding protein ArtM [Tissierella creatinophila DSM 6911]